MRPLLLAISGILSLSAVAAAQDPLSLVKVALDNRKAEAASQTRYTCFRHVKETNRDAKGKVTYSWNRVFEETWINNLPYQRMVERAGKPLKGKELRQEEALYDDAISGRRPLGNTERIVLEQAHPVSSGADVFDALKPTYTVTEVGQEPSPDGTLRILEAAHVRNKSTTCAWRYRLWITEDAKLLRFHADVAPNDGHTPCGDATEDETRTLIDGMPKLASSRAHFYVPSGDTWVTVDSDISFTDYRRFTTKVTLSPATLAEPE